MVPRGGFRVDVTVIRDPRDAQHWRLYQGANDGLLSWSMNGGSLRRRRNADPLLSCRSSYTWLIEATVGSVDDGRTDG